jgi:ribosomal RNA-processing protein 9
MDSFFLTETFDPDAKLSNAQRKRQRMADRASLQPNKKVQKDKIKPKKHMESASESGSDEDIDTMKLTRDDDSSEEEVQETAAQKRLRLAKGYLSKIQQEVHDIQDGEIDAKEIDKELIADRLRNDALEVSGRAFTMIAESWSTLDFSEEYIRTFKCGAKGPQQSLTCVAFAETSSTDIKPTQELHLYAASKDACIVKWNFKTGERVHITPGGLKPTKKLIKSIGTRVIESVGHNDHVLCLAVSSDGKFLVSNDDDVA